VTESEWVDLIASRLRAASIGRRFEIATRRKLAYAHEITAYGETPTLKRREYQTDIAILEAVGDRRWKPRVVVEAKVGNSRGGMPLTHDAITYSQKAAAHRAVHPYLRYGMMLGHRRHYPLPGRLYRHGAQFDFMISFAAHEPTDEELRTFLGILKSEISASQTLEKILYESRLRTRDRYTVLHRRLIVG
jgi:hypothetical protein